MLIADWIAAVALAVGITTWIADKLIDYFKSRRDEERAMLSAHFSQMADSLSAMVIAFRANRIPREDGHRYETLVQQVADLLESSGFGSTEELLPKRDEFIRKLRQAAAAALNLDYAEDLSDDQRGELIASLERLAGDLSGVATRLRPSA